MERNLRPVLSLLGETAVAQDEKEPAEELVRVLALSELIVRAQERILHRVLGRVLRPQHPRSVTRVAVAISLDQHGVALTVARKHRPHDFAVGATPRLPLQPFSSAKERLCRRGVTLPPPVTGHL